MPEPQFEDIVRQLADLAERPEISFSLRAYLRSAAERDIIDMMNKIEVLTKTIGAEAISLTSDQWPEWRQHTQQALGDSSKWFRSPDFLSGITLKLAVAVRSRADYRTAT